MNKTINTTAVNKAWAARIDSFNEELRLAPEMAVNKQKWGDAIRRNPEKLDSFQYAGNWARVMQFMKNRDNKNYEDIAMNASIIADPNISQEIFINAISLLIEHWNYGNELAKWFENNFGSLELEQTNLVA